MRTQWSGHSICFIGSPAAFVTSISLNNSRVCVLALVYYQGCIRGVYAHSLQWNVSLRMKVLGVRTDYFIIFITYCQSSYSLDSLRLPPISVCPSAVLARQVVSHHHLVQLVRPQGGNRCILVWQGCYEITGKGRTIEYQREEVPA